MTLTSDQQQAVDRIGEWYFSEPERQRPFNLQGYAGTGKTWLGARLPELLGIDPADVLYLAPTNKARKRIELEAPPSSTVRTVTKHTRSPSELTDEDIEQLEKQIENTTDPALLEELTDRLKQWKRKLERGEPLFVARDGDDDGLPRLTLVDEASMLKCSQTRDIWMHCGPTIYVGDPFQLPPVQDAYERKRDPVGSAPYYETVKADAVLEEIKRQAKGSSIVLAAQWVRQHWNDCFAHLLDPTEVRMVAAGERRGLGCFGDIHDMTMIGWRHLHRIEMATKLRKGLGLPRNPAYGDELIALRPWDDDAGARISISDTLQCVGRWPEADTDEIMHLELHDHDADRKYRVRVWLPALHDGPGYSKVQVPAARRANAACMGFATSLTAHNSQGSEFPFVLIHDRKRMGSTEEQMRWLYTAITRASGRLWIS